MNPKRNGIIFIVLMIALVAYGFGSIADALGLDGNNIVNLIPSNVTSFNSQQISQIDDPSFKPVYLISHVIINTTNTTTNSSGNIGNQTNKDQNN